MNCLQVIDGNLPSLASVVLWFSDACSDDRLLVRVYIKEDFFQGQSQTDVTQCFQVIQDSGLAFPYRGGYVRSHEYKFCLTISGHMVLAGRVSRYSTPKAFLAVGGKSPGEGCMSRGRWQGGKGFQYFLPL